MDLLQLTSSIYEYSGIVNKIKGASMKQSATVYNSITHKLLCSYIICVPLTGTAL